MPNKIPTLSNYLLNRMFVILLFIFFAVMVSAQPVITSFSPVSAPVGTTITITGANFSATPSNNIVYFGAVKANVTGATGTTLTVAVPSGATYQPISVTVGGLTGYSQRHFLVTFTGGSPIASSSFGNRQDFTTDIRPNAIALSDFDGDGRVDVATANNHSNAGVASVSILRNTSNGGAISFAPKQDIVTGAVTYCITSADIDGDGKQDLISGSIANSTISVFRNTSISGVISFAPKVDYTITGAPYDIAAKDFDGDGKTDLAVADNGITFQAISVFRNTGAIGAIAFAPKVDLSTQLSPKTIVSSDFDGDGKADIAFTNENSNSFSLYRNTSSSGALAFASRIDFSCGTGNKPYSISLADIDGDGKMDAGIVFTNTSAGGGMQLYRNTSATGAIALNLATSLTGGVLSNVYYHSAFDDLNGDGKPDLALSIGSAGVTRVYQNNSTTGVFSFGNLSNLFNSFAPYNVVMADLDGDGRTDLIESEFTMEHVSVFKNNSGSPVVSSFAPPTAGNGTTVTIFGLNFLGASSVKFGGVPAQGFSVNSANSISATVGLGASGSVEVTNALGTGALTGFVFAGPPTISSFTPLNAGQGNTVTITGTNFTGTSAVSFGSVPASNYTIVNATTITAVVGTGTSGNISVTNPFGTATLGGFIFQPPPTIASFTPTGGGASTSVLITGANFDNVQSISIGGVAVASFVVNSSSSITATVAEGATGGINITTLWGSVLSSQIFSFPPPVITSFSPLTGPVGTPIVITGSNFRTTPSSNHVFFGATKASVTSASPVSITALVPPGATFQPISISVNNHTTSSSQNFVTTNSNSNPISNNRAFGWTGAVLAGESPNSVKLADLDGDGKSDIITGGNNFSRTVSALRNTSTSDIISFADTVRLITGLGTQILIEIADMNSDGKLDVVAVGNQTVVSVLINTSVVGTISFRPAVVFSAFDWCRGLTLADFDGDSKVDIAVSSGFMSGHVLSFFRNTGVNGDVNFASRIDIAATGIPHAISAADLDRDNKPDIVIGAETYVGGMRNISTVGSILFSGLQTFSMGYHTTIATGDIDGDNLIDVLSNGVSVTSMTALRNTSVAGAVTFAAPVAIPGYSNSLYIRLGLLDGDGKPDLIIMPANDKKVYFKRNESSPGTILFGGGIEFSPLLTFNWVNDVAIGDLEGDHKVDFVVTNGPDNKISIFRNRSGFPTISSFAPSTASTGATVQISGSNFIGVNTLRFGNTPASSFSVINANTINAVVGSGSSGAVFTGSPVGTDSLAGFIFTGVPAITSFTPTSAPAGTTITISGTNFTGATSVLFGGVAASSFTVVNPTTITAVTGTGASGNVSITASGGTASLAGFTFINPPTISSFTPTTAATNAIVTITGTNFTGATAVRFGGVAAASFIVANPTTITAVVGTGASGSVSVTTPGGTANLTGFTYSLITAVTPPIVVNVPELIVTPNPGHALITIRHLASAKEATIRFVDIAGKQVRKITVPRSRTQTETDISHLPAGIYYIIWEDDKRRFARVFMAE